MICKFIGKVESFETRNSKNGTPFTFCRCSTLGERSDKFVSFWNGEDLPCEGGTYVFEVRNSKRGLSIVTSGAEK